MFFTAPCTKTEQCEQLVSMQQKRTLTKTEQCERALREIPSKVPHFEAYRIENICFNI